MIPGWFQKAQKPKDKIEEMAGDVTDQMNADIQGGYTDHHQSPYSKRMQMDPLHGEELEAFEYAIKKLDRQYKDSSFKDLIEYGFDDGWFTTDKEGMLRVSEEAPA